MYIKQNMYIGGKEKVVAAVEEINEKFKQTMELLYKVSLQEFGMDVEINRYSQKSGTHIQLSGVDDAVVKIQCAINGFEHVLAMLNTLPGMVKELDETINQPQK